jgi:hypothetical protein
MCGVSGSHCGTEILHELLPAVSQSTLALNVWTCCLGPPGESRCSGTIPLNFSRHTPASLIDNFASFFFSSHLRYFTTSASTLSRDLL